MQQKLQNAKIFKRSRTSDLQKVSGCDVAVHDATAV